MEAGVREAAAEALVAGAAELGLRLPPAGVERLLAFLGELQRWNRAYSLVADGSSPDWVGRHLLDSLSIADPLRVLAVEAGRLEERSAGELSRSGSPRSQDRTSALGEGISPPGEGTSPLGEGVSPPGEGVSPLGEGTSPPWERGHPARADDGGPAAHLETGSPRSPDHPGRASRPFRVLDLGSGAGLPGIPLAIALPELRFVLLDGNGKKVRFCRHAVTALGLPNVEVVEERAERYAPTAPFDAAVVRAVGSLARIRALVRPRCRGPILAMKGRYPSRELEALGRVPFEAARLRIPGLEAERHLVVLR